MGACRPEVVRVSTCRLKADNRNGTLYFNSSPDRFFSFLSLCPSHRKQHPNATMAPQPNARNSYKAQPAYIVGVGMTAFQKPRGLVDYPDLGLEAATKALVDAGVNYDEVQQAYVGYCYGDSTCGQRALYSLGMTGIPISNVNNNCSYVCC